MLSVWAFVYSRFLQWSS